MDSRLDFGKMEFGCKHSRRRCKIRAPCCNEFFGCLGCHNESTPEEHEAYSPRDVEKVVCLICDVEQPVAQICMNCGVKMGEYFCEICKVYEDDMEKGTSHCNDCGFCRHGGKNAKFVYCKKCGDCRFVDSDHPCLENSSRQPCPICYENIFDSFKRRTILKCGHNIHAECLHKMKINGRYSCPLCSKTIYDMSLHWMILDKMIQASQPRSPSKVWILCNDCNCTSEVTDHIFGEKCGKCLSYNTRRIAPPPVKPQ